MKVLFLTIILTAAAFAQDAPKCDHETASKTRFDLIRITPPVQILDWNGRTLNVKFEDKDGVYLQTFEADKASIVKLPKDYRKIWFFVLYCSKCWHLYVVDQLTDEQMKGMKKRYP